LFYEINNPSFSIIFSSHVKTPDKGKQELA